MVITEPTNQGPGQYGGDGEAEEGERDLPDSHLRVLLQSGSQGGLHGPDGVRGAPPAQLIPSINLQETLRRVQSVWVGT